MKKLTSKKEIDDLSYQVIGAAIEVHKQLGPGLWRAFIIDVWKKN